MNDAGRIGFVIRGAYDISATYDFLDVVYYNGNSYVAKKLTVGNEPQESSEYWQILAKGGIEDVGIQFQEAAERQNIQSGEDTPTLFGKIKKWFAELKTVAFSGNYSDLENKPTARDIGALPTTGGDILGSLSIAGDIYANDISPAESRQRNGTIILHKSIYGGGSAKVEKLSGVTPILAESDILNTTEEISANTNSSNVVGALMAKTMLTDYNTKINQINSNLVYKAGDTIGKTDTFMWIFGTLTNGNKDMLTFAPVNKPIVGNIKFSLLEMAIRQNGEYLFDTGKGDNIAGIEINVINFPNSGLYIKFFKSDGWGGINNDIVSLGIRFRVTIS